MRRVPTEDQQHVQWLGCWACNMRYQNSMILLLIRPLKSAHTCSVRRAVFVTVASNETWETVRLVLETSGSTLRRSRRSTVAQVVKTGRPLQVTASLSRSWLLGHNSQRLSIGLVQLTEPLACKEISRIRTGDTGTRSTRERSFCDRREAVETTRNVGSPHVMTHFASCSLDASISRGRDGRTVG